MLPAKLVLKTGEVFYGHSPAWQQQVFPGEVVFNTSMVGYIEALTDPSYRGQILTFTYPIIGNYGVPASTDWESECIQANGVVVSTAAPQYHHYAAEQSFLGWCEAQQVPVITGVDTRALAKVLSHRGVVLGAICSAEIEPEKFIDFNEQHLVSEVSVKEPSWHGKGEKTVIAVDCGMKNNIMRCLEELPIRIKRVPYNYDFIEEDYDGVFISNGPGDPTQCSETVALIKKVIAAEKPLFGICLGSQLMALAIGAQTYKLPFGHRAQNHPCMELATDRCFLTSQNHGYAIAEESLPANWEVTFRNLNDNTVQGIQHRQLPMFSVQFHPEAAPGPVDTHWMFQKFYECL